MAQPHLPFFPCVVLLLLSILCHVLSRARRFRGDAGLLLLQKGGPLVIRRLCAAMGPEVVFREFASILDDEQDLAFASTMVQVGMRHSKAQHVTAGQGAWWTHSPSK
jgi:hypothetical protein